GDDLRGCRLAVPEVRRGSLELFGDFAPAVREAAEWVAERDVLSARVQRLVTLWITFPDSVQRAVCLLERDFEISWHGLPLPHGHAFETLNRATSHGPAGASSNAPSSSPSNDATDGTGTPSKNSCGITSIIVMTSNLKATYDSFSLETKAKLTTTVCLRVLGQPQPLLLEPVAFG